MLIFMQQKTYLFQGVWTAINGSGTRLLRCLLPLLLFVLPYINYSPLKAEDRAVVQSEAGAVRTASFPNDPAYQQGDQYALDLINIQGAWRYTHGDPRVVVALIDTGVDFSHPELMDHIHPDARTFFLQSTPQDENGHGTLTAGIIAGATHNTLGAAGIASNVQILPIKVSPGVSRELDSAAAHQSEVIDEALAPAYNFQEPIRYAVSPDRNGTRVININFATSLDDPEERKAIEEATHAGVLVVAAAGNTGQNRALFPAAYDCVIGVGAVDSKAQRASFSTYGLGVDVVAPGVSIYGADLMGESGYGRGDYGSASGTSFAAPHVSGVAALIFSARPDLTAWDVREILLRSAKDLGAPGFDVEYGYGLVDAGAALDLAKVWRAHSGKVVDHCTGDRYRVYGSLYFDQNGNRGRDTGELAFSEPYTATTTYVELYAQNGARRLDITFPNQNGIFTFDVVYDPADAPYIVKLQNTTHRQQLFFVGGVAGPYNFDMPTFSTQSLVMHGTLFLDTDGDGLQAGDEPVYTDAQRYHTTVALYEANRQEPSAVATSDQLGAFSFYLMPPTTTVTYTLQTMIAPNLLRLTRLYTVTIDPATPHQLAYAIGLDPDDLPVEGQDQTPNPTPVELQVITHTGSTVLQWVTPQPLRTDSVFELAYARQAGGPYQTLALTALAQTTSYTLFDLPGATAGGDYYFVVRARTPDNAQSAFWSGYSNEAMLSLLPTNQIFLPMISR